MISRLLLKSDQYLQSPILSQYDSKLFQSVNLQSSLFPSAPFKPLATQTEPFDIWQFITQNERNKIAKKNLTKTKNYDSNGKIILNHYDRKDIIEWYFLLQTTNTVLNHYQYKPLYIILYISLFYHYITILYSFYQI